MAASPAVDLTALDPQRVRKIETRAAELRSWAAQERRDIEREWDAMDEVYHHLGATHLDPVQKSLRASLGLSTPPPRVHARIGLAYPVTQIQVAAITAEPLRLKARPRSDELTHQIAAVAGQGLLDWWKDTLALDVEFERAALSVRLYNLAWAAFGWNPYAGPPDPYDPGEVAGDVFFRVRSVRSIFPDPSSIDDRDMGFLWDVERLSPAVLPPDVRAFAQSRGRASGSSELSRFIESARGNESLTRFGRREAKTEKDHLVEIAHLHCRPGSGLFMDERERLNEQDDYGLHMIFVNGMHFTTMEAPYAREGVMFGYASSRFTEDAERRYSAGDARVLYSNDPVLSDLMNANYAHQKHGRKHKIFSRPGLDLKGRMVSEANEVIEVDDDFSDQSLRVFVQPPVTQADLAVPDTISAHVKMATATPDVLFGVAGTNMDTATTFVAAKGGAEMRTGKTRAHIVQMFKTGMSANLKIASRRMPAGRMIELTGPSYPVRQMVVDGEGLGALSVDIMSDATFSSNTFLRGEQVKSLVQTMPGVFTAKEVKDWLKLPQSETALFDEDTVQRGNADAQAWLVLNGEMPPEAILNQPGVDNDMIFVERTRLWLASALGRNARVKYPASWIGLRADMAVRERRIAEAQMQALLMANGVGPENPGGDGPGSSKPSGDLTPQTVGGKGAGQMGQRSTKSDGIEQTLGRTNPAVANGAASSIIGNRERVTGGIS